MPAHRPLRILSAGALVLGGAALAVRLSGGVPERQLPATAPAATEPATPTAAPVQIAAQPAPLSEPPAPPTPNPEPGAAVPAAAPIPEWQVDNSPRAQMERACERAVAELRPVPFGTDEQNAEMAAQWRELRETTRKRSREQPSQQAAPAPIKCPEDLVRTYYERARELDLRLREEIMRDRSKER